MIIYSLFFCFESLTAQIVSTSTGGNWSSGSTWIGGVAPGPTSDVVIDGNVKVDISTTCNNLTVNGSGTLSPPTFGNRTLTVSGSLTNYGIITDDFYRLYLNIAGDVINNGTWANYRTTLNGADQNLTATSPFTGNSLIRNNGPGKVIAWSDLELIGCIIKFNNDTLYMTDGYSITETDKRLENIVIEKDPAGSNPVTINLSNAWYQFLTCIADTTILLGDHQAGSSVVFKSNVVNNGTFKNYSSGSSTVTLEKSLINNGSVADNYYNTSLLLYGDLINNGSLSNKYIYLRGTADQHIWSYNPITVNNITNQELSGLVVAETNLSFSGTNVNLVNDTIKFTGGDSLHLEAGAKLINTVLLSVPAKAAGTFSIDLAGNSYVQNFVASADGFNLSGDFQINPGNCVLNGPVNILGTLRPTGTGSVTATLNGDVVNEGTITNNYYSLTLNIAGNVVQNGVWDNHTTNLNGNNQNLTATAPFTSSMLIRINGPGKVTLLSDLTLNNCVLAFNNDTLYMADGYSITETDQRLENIVIEKDPAGSNPVTLNLSNALYQNFTCIADTTVLLGDHQAGYSVFFKSNVVNNGTFKNTSSGSSTVTFEKSLINNGLVADNYYNTSLLLYGDLINNGSLSNKYIYLQGTEDQHIWSYNPITVNNITNQTLSGLVVAETNLSFSGTNVNLNNDTLKFTGGDSLHLEAGAKLRNTVLLSVPAKATGTFSIDMTGNSYVENLVASADGFNLSGDFQISPGNCVLNGPVNILGTFRPTGTGTVTATLNGDVVNEGTITNNYYSLTLNITGNVVHNGVWDNNYTSLTGSGIRNINQTQPFGSNTFEVSGGINQVNFLSVCWFENTNCEMGGTTVVMPVKSSVILSAGKFRNAVLQANESELLMSSACYFENVSISNLDMHGFVLIGTGCSLDGLCRVFGSMSNLATGTYTLYVYGTLENHGTITNNFYNFIIDVKGNIRNNGDWLNEYTIMTGIDESTDQSITLLNGHTINGKMKFFTQLTNINYWEHNGTTLVGNGGYSGASSQTLTFLTPVSGPAHNGWFRAHSSNGNTYSRHIYVNEETTQTLLLSARVFLEGSFQNSSQQMEGHEGLLPLAHPYGSSPWFYPGTESVTAVPVWAVDWVLIELRDATDANSANSATRIARRVGFLLEDGSITDLNGTGNPLEFKGVTVQQNLFVVVRSRNHLDVMSAFPLSETGGVYSYDFTVDTWQAYGGPLASKLLSTNPVPLYGMYGGDLNADGFINEPDIRVSWMQNAGKAFIYQSTDINMDQQVDNNDKNDYCAPNFGSSTQFPE